MPRFSGQDLTCIRGERLVFQGLDFAVETGGALVLTGPNGCGKSSLLRLMTGLLPPAAGVLAWDGEAIDQDRDAHGGHLHYVGHLDAVKPMLTVAENVSFWAALADNAGASGTNPAIAAGDALDAFGLSHLAAMPARFLSAGQKRRVNLARLIAAPAALWLLDEPMTALDTQAMGRLRAAIVTHRAGGGMVVIATHVETGLDAVETVNVAAYTDTGSTDTGSTDTGSTDTGNTGTGNTNVGGAP